MTDPRARQLKIQTGVVKRITKEKLMYEKENKQIEDRIEKMKKEGRDEYEIKKMGEVLAESKMMIPDCLKRLVTATEDLRNKLDDVEGLGDIPEVQEAHKQLQEAENMLNE